MRSNIYLIVNQVDIKLGNFTRINKNSQKKKLFVCKEFYMKIKILNSSNFESIVCLVI